MRDLEKEVATLRVENDLLKARVKSDPNDERLKAIDFVVQALRTGEFESLSLKMEEISNKQIEAVWNDGGQARVSSNAGKGGKKRVEKSPKEMAMRAIEKEHDALKPHQKTWGYLAPFARDMQKKYPIIENPTSIERRIKRYLEKWSK